MPLPFEAMSSALQPSTFNLQPSTNQGSPGFFNSMTTRMG